MEVILHKQFKKKLRLALEANGWSQSDLAREMGVAPQYVHKYLKGDVCPGLDVVERFAKALGVEPIAMLDDSEILQMIG